MKITNPIPDQNFELALNKIGEILFVELENQKILKNLPNNQSIYNSRLVPFSPEEDVLVNVMFAGVETFDDRGFGGSEGYNIFHIDVTTRGKEKDGSNGGFEAMKTLNMYLGMIRFILDSPKYLFLELPQGVVSYQSVKEIKIFDNLFSKDTSFIKEGRLLFATKINECNEYEEGVPFESNITNVKLDLTEKGYQYIFNN